MYADKVTDSMQRRDRGDGPPPRRSSCAYNEEHGITPETIVKGVSDIAEFLCARVAERAGPAPARRAQDRGHVGARSSRSSIVTLEEEMLAAAEELRFEYAAKLRDEIKELRRELLALAV